MGRLEEIRQQVGKSRCDRCGFLFPVEELHEEEETGLVVDSKCLDKRSFNEMKGEAPRESVDHHFTT